MIGGSLLLSSAGPLSRAFAQSPQSPTTQPFVDDLAFPPVAQTVPRFSAPLWNSFLDADTKFFHIITERRLVKFHRDLPPTEIWGYRDLHTPLSSDPAQNPILGPTFQLSMAAQPGADRKIRGGYIVRHTGSNNLPPEDEPLPFGEAKFTVHQHGGHLPSRADGYPTDPLIFDGQPFNVTYHRGTSFDHFYPLTDEGFTGLIDPTERPSTMWYHDHILDFTGPNVYRGLAGFFLVHEDETREILNADGKRLPALDTGNEQHPAPALGLPSGAFDIPLVLQDKIFAPDGALVFDPLNQGGFLGDKMLVNGKIQPKHAVQPRRYRLRFLNGSNARFYHLSLVTASGTPVPMSVIATEGGLLSRALSSTGFLLGMAERIEVVVDLKNYKGQDLYLVNRMAQDDGRGPSGTFERPELVSRGTPLLKLTVGNAAVNDTSRPVPAGRVLRPFAPIPRSVLASAKRRKFEFDRRHGLWAINGELAGILDRPLATPALNGPEIWTIVNKSGGWWHPIHVHSEFGRVIRRKGFAQPPLLERDGIAKKDTIVLGPNSEVDVFFDFRDFRGPYVFHCHNIEHEDHQMMARFDVGLGNNGERGSEA
jgi:FtsP/CotA-like multicopper oxidase with cupredoxin domain